MKTTRKPTREDLIKKIVDIDVELSNNRYEHHLTGEQALKMRMKRDRLEKQLYKTMSEIR